MAAVAQPGRARDCGALRKGRHRDPEVPGSNPGRGPIHSSCQIGWNIWVLRALGIRNL